MDQCVWYLINKAPIIRKQCSIIENIIEHCSCLCEYIILEQNIVNHREKKVLYFYLRLRPFSSKLITEICVLLYFSTIIVVN